MRGLLRHLKLSIDTDRDFTNRARLAVALAEQFARERKAVEVEPEDILRGVASGGHGVGRTVLDGMGVDLFRLLPEIAELAPTFPAKPLPTIDEMLKSDPAKYFPPVVFGRAGKASLQAARSAAKNLHHNYLGTEHLVMGLINGSSSAAAFLRQRGVTAESFRAGVVQLLCGDGS